MSGTCEIIKGQNVTFNATAMCLGGARMCLESVEEAVATQPAESKAEGKPLVVLETAPAPPLWRYSLCARPHLLN